MLTHADVRRLAMALPETHEAPHFEATSFRVNRKIFCTMGENGPGIVIKLPPEDQHNLAADASAGVRPVAGYWGRSGWTDVDLSTLDEGRLEALLRLSWSVVAPKRLTRV